MEQKTVLRLAGALKLLVTATFFCNLLVLPLVPGLVWSNQLEGAALLHTGAWSAVLLCVQALRAVWYTQYGIVLTLFLLVCGVCTAIILWQARRILDTILREDTFCYNNARNMKRVAACCFIISLAALVRVFWGLSYYKSVAPLLTYNALFFPIFLMGGLLCMVMSALFRQAAVLREENDLTI